MLLPVHKNPGTATAAIDHGGFEAGAQEAAPHSLRQMHLAAYGTGGWYCQRTVPADGGRWSCEHAEPHGATHLRRPPCVFAAQLSSKYAAQAPHVVASYSLGRSSNAQKARELVRN